MNKGRRNELKKLKYKKRLINIRQLNNDTLTSPKGVHNGIPYNFTSFIESGKPCSCLFCTGKKYNRAKEKRNNMKQDDDYI